MSTPGLMPQINVTNRPLIDLTYLTTDVDPANQTVYTHTGITFGAAHDNRRIIVFTGTSDTGSNDVVSVTIGGEVAVPLKEQQGPSSGGYSRTEAWQALVATGTTGTVVVTYANGTYRNVISLYRTTNWGGAAVSTDGDDEQTEGSSGSQTLVMSCGRGGAIIAGCHNAESDASSSQPWVFNGVALTEDYSDYIESSNRVWSVGHAIYAEEQTDIDCVVTNAGGMATAASVGIGVDPS